MLSSANRVARWVSRRPVPVFLIVTLFFYYRAVDPFSWELSLLFTLPVLLLNWLVAGLLQRFLHGRPGALQRENFSPPLEQEARMSTTRVESDRTPVVKSRNLPGAAIFSGVLLTAMGALDLYWISPWAISLLLLVFAWQLGAWWFHRAGVYYALFSSIIVFVLVFYSYRLLAWEAYLYSSYIISERVSELQTDSRIAQWITDEQGGRTLLINGEKQITISADRAQRIYEQDEIPETLRVFRIFGSPVGVYRMGEDAGSPLPLVVFLDPPFRDRPDFQEVRREASPVFMHLNLRGLEVIDPAGQKQVLERNGYRLTGVQWQLENEQGGVTDLTLFYSDDFNKLHLAFLVLSPRVAGFPVHPSFLDLLDSLDTPLPTRE